MDGTLARTVIHRAVPYCSNRGYIDVTSSFIVVIGGKEAWFGDSTTLLNVTHPRIFLHNVFILHTTTLSRSMGQPVWYDRVSTEPLRIQDIPSVCV